MIRLTCIKYKSYIKRKLALSLQMHCERVNNLFCCVVQIDIWASVVAVVRAQKLAEADILLTAAWTASERQQLEPDKMKQGLVEQMDVWEELLMVLLANIQYVTNVIRGSQYHHQYKPIISHQVQLIW